MANMFSSVDDPELVRLLRAGALGVLPTDTVYGLVCAASNQAAVQRLYALKHRHHKPGTIIASNVEQLINLGIKARYLKVVAQYWPGSISIIVPDEPSLAYLDLGKQSLALRVPSDEIIQNLLERTGPLLTTSANQPNEPTAVNIAQAKAYFGDTVDFYVDGGDFQGRPASTLIRIVDDVVEVLRPGSIEISESGQIIQADHS